VVADLPGCELLEAEAQIVLTAFGPAEAAGEGGGSIEHGAAGDGGGGEFISPGATIFAIQMIHNRIENGGGLKDWTSRQCAGLDVEFTRVVVRNKSIGDEALRIFVDDGGFAGGEEGSTAGGNDI